ncbi:hypothetical protein K440DRAFT_675258 [Wilcoxina mikolae CBS 423.85]|nr:hypothetical protein K440DRAFT_675258 [Wilcoxina mikolae CBS 423.85]
MTPLVSSNNPYNRYFLYGYYNFLVQRYEAYAAGSQGGQEAPSIMCFLRKQKLELGDEGNGRRRGKSCSSRSVILWHDEQGGYGSRETVYLYTKDIEEVEKVLESDDRVLARLQRLAGELVLGRKPHREDYSRPRTTL